MRPLIAVTETSDARQKPEGTASQRPLRRPDSEGIGGSRCHPTEAPNEAVIFEGVTFDEPQAYDLAAPKTKTCSFCSP